VVITVYKDNLAPSLFDTIRQAGVAFDLAGSTVKLQAREEDGTALVIDAAATIITASTTLSAETVLPEPTITVADASGFLASGALSVGGQIVEYDEISGKTFLGCRGGEGTIASGATVTQRGGVRYDWVAADVDTAVELEAWWRVTLASGKVQESPPFQIVVVDPLAVQKGLCELSDVISYAPRYRSERTTDALLERMILAESRMIQRETGREFLALSPAVNPRRFDLTLWHVRHRKVYIGDAAAVTTVKVIDYDQSTVVETIASTNYVLMPRVRDTTWEPITALHFPPQSPDPADLYVGRVLEVDGTWGFPAVPDDIREACAKLVVARYAFDVASAGTQLAEALDAVNVGALFASGRAVVESYRTLLAA
jgi:hypothetical protein